MASLGPKQKKAFLFCCSALRKWVHRGLHKANNHGGSRQQKLTQYIYCVLSLEANKHKNVNKWYFLEHWEKMHYYVQHPIMSQKDSPNSFLFYLLQWQTTRAEHRLCQGFGHDLRRLEQEVGAFRHLPRAVQSSYLSPFYQQYLQSCREKATRPRGKQVSKFSSHSI